MRFMIFVGSPAKAAPVRSYRGSTRPIRPPAGVFTEAGVALRGDVGMRNWASFSADSRAPPDLKRLGEEGLGFADGLMEVRRLVVCIQSGHVGPLLDQNKYLCIARVLQNLVAHAAGFLARLRRELENDGR